MRVFGDLNGREDNEPNNPPGSGAVGSEGDSERARKRIEEQLQEPAGGANTPPYLSVRRSNGELWFALFVLTLAVIGAGACGYLRLRSNHIALSQVPGLLRSVVTMSGRVDAAEARLRELSGEWNGLADHLAQLDRKVDSSLRASREQTRDFVAQATGRLQAELDRRSGAVDARLNKVESMQRQDQARLAELNDQLRGQVAHLHQQLTAAQESTGHDLAAVQEQARNNQGNLETLSKNLHRDKTTFEIVKNSPTELAPGLTLTILKTDANYQRFRGYISLTHEGKTLWLNNLSAKETVDLYSQQYNHPYSLVVTAVNDEGVAGYLLLPAGA